MQDVGLWGPGFKISGGDRSLRWTCGSLGSLKIMETRQVSLWTDQWQRFKTPAHLSFLLQHGTVQFRVDLVLMFPTIWWVTYFSATPLALVGWDPCRVFFALDHILVSPRRIQLLTCDCKAHGWTFDTLTPSIWEQRTTAMLRDKCKWRCLTR